jgi:hypothetical protein
MSQCNRATAHSQDKEEKSFKMERYWFGIVSEFDKKASFARKLRVFIASETMLEGLVTDLKIDQTLPGGTSPDPNHAPTPDNAETATRIERFGEFCKAKEEFIQAIEDIQKAKGIKLSVDDACQEDTLSQPLGAPADAAGNSLTETPEDKNLREKVNGLRKKALAALKEMKLHCGGALPNRFMNGKVVDARSGLKRWQGMVEMAHIYADHEKEEKNGMNTRGGGLLMPIAIPIDIPKNQF